MTASGEGGTRPAPRGAGARFAAVLLLGSGWLLLALLLPARAHATDWEQVPDPRLSLTAGTEFEATDQSFGFQTWLDPAEAIDWTSQTRLETLRNVEYERELLATLGLTYRPRSESLLRPEVGLAGSWGERRRSLGLRGEAASRDFRAEGWSVRQSLQIEEQEESTGARLTTGEELLYLRWRRAITPERWSLAVRSTLDPSVSTVT